MIVRAASARGTLISIAFPQRQPKQTDQLTFTFVADGIESAISYFLFTDQPNLQIMDHP